MPLHTIVIIVAVMVWLGCTPAIWAWLNWDLTDEDIHRNYARAIDATTAILLTSDEVRDEMFVSIWSGNVIDLIACEARWSMSGFWRKLVRRRSEKTYALAMRMHYTDMAQQMCAYQA